MVECRILINAPLEEMEARFQNYEDLELSEAERQGWTLLEVFSGTEFFGWEIVSWVELAKGNELIYAYYDEDMNAEFVHVRDGACLRAYQQYDGETDTDEGEDPETAITGWADVANYMDEHMS